MNEQQNPTYSDHVKRSTYITVSVVLFLIIIKLFAYIFTGSISILSTLADSVVDFVISFINLILISISLKPADDDHRWGHARLEAVTAFLEGIFLILTSLFILYMAAVRMIYPEDIESSSIGIVVMLISILVTLLLVRYQKTVIQKTSSLAISADHVHYKQDILSNIAALVALVLAANFGFTRIDPLMGALISFYILFSSIGIIRNSIDVLLDKEIDDDLKEEIKTIVLSQVKVEGFHDFKSRRSGGSRENFFIQMHLEINKHTSLLESHNISDAVEEKLKERFPEIQIILHVDPSDLVEEQEWHD